MNEKQLEEKLRLLLSVDAENEVIEFKEAKNQFDSDKLGKYFSALSNEANIKNKECAWLILGVNDRHQVVGSEYGSGRGGINEIKHKIAEHTNGRNTFFDIHVLNLPEGRVVMFQIPPASKGIPVSYKGHYYGREGESLAALSIQKIEMLRRQSVHEDWSSVIVEQATIDDLDPDAIKKARNEYKAKHHSKNAEVDQWSDLIFLNKTKLTVQGKITRAALLLLGKDKSSYLLSPADAKISWILKDSNNHERDYEHFTVPFILASDKVLAKIRNLSYRYMPDNTLFPIEISQYDSFVIREALHNCIAHQDYNLQSKIVVVEFPDYLIFQNAGEFLPETVENVIEQDAPQIFYRNKFLSEAMVNLNMIDTIGSGIKKMFSVQRDRFFPLPDYDLTNKQAVKLKIFGTVLNRNYTQMLMEKTDLDLHTVILLDKLQKGKKLSADEAKLLKSKKLIEGRKPNYYVAASIADLSGEKAQYIKNKGFKDGQYKKLIVDYIQKFGSASRQDIQDLLFDSLPRVLSDEQKQKKLTNLLYMLSKKEGIIENASSSYKYSSWILKKN